MNQHTSVMVLVSLGAMFWLIAADSGRPVHAEGQDERAPVFEYMQKSFAGYAMSGGRDAKTRFPLHSEAVYHWTVQISGRNDGALFLWLHEGRPEIAGCVVTRPSKRIIYHEFHSLSQRPITATMQDRTIWHPEKPGLRMEPVPDGPAPASSAVRRRSQMRTLAKDFSASVIHQKDDTRWETRMLARPVYEYSDEDGDVLDGGLFLFVRENDPQLLVVLEARRGESADRWQYGVARLSSNEISIEYNQGIVQTIPKWPWRFKPTGDRPRDEPYAQFMMGTYPPAAADSAAESSTDSR